MLSDSYKHFFFLTIATVHACNALSVYSDLAAGQKSQ